MRRSVAAVVFGGALLVAHVAHAADGHTEAAKLYAQGSEAFDRGDFQIAAVAFEAALAKAPHGRTAMSAALAWESAGDAPRAADLFARAISLDGLSPDESKEATRKLAAYEVRLGTIDVDGEGVASIAHVEGRKLPFVVHVTPGRWPITFVGGDGVPVEASTEISAGQRARVAPPARPKAAPPPPASNAAPATPSIPPSEGDPGAVQRGFGYTTVALAGGATIACAVLGGLTLSTRADYEASGFTDVDLHDRGTALRTWTNVSLGAAAGLSVLGTILLVTAPHASDDAAVSMDAGGITMRFR